MPEPSPLTIVALGGLGQIGMNCLVLEQLCAEDGGQRERLVIDCGVTFPTGDEGVELYHPRFDLLLDEAQALLGLVLTHGHEDHIGAVPYLLAGLEARARLSGTSSRPLVIWAPPYSVELCRQRIEEHGFGGDALELRAIAPGQRYSAGSFVFEPVRVSHSTVDSVGLIIDTRAGRVVHTGDFKLEAEPLDGEPTDEARFRQAGDAGVALLLSDSTNIFSGGTAGGESGVASALERIVTDASGRVVVGLFASNVNRLGALAEIATRTGRKLCLLGRSLHRHAEVARALDRLEWPSGQVVSPDVAAQLPRHEVLFTATGTQAEPFGALARLAAAQHPELRLEAGDTVVLSSRVIPGSERAVHAMCDGFVRIGVELRTRATDPLIHVSGHAHKDEQRRMLELVRPRAFMPLHGTHHHLVEHAKLARSMGAETLVIVDGESAELAPPAPDLAPSVGPPSPLAGAASPLAGAASPLEGAASPLAGAASPVEGAASPLEAAAALPLLRKLAPVVAGRVAVASGGRPVDDATLRARRSMARSGAVFVALGFGPGFGPGFGTGPARDGARILVRVAMSGVPDPELARRVAIKAARSAAWDAAALPEAALLEAVRRAVRRGLAEVCRERPSVSVVLLARAENAAEPEVAE